jgi:NTP pyrophosphatase (non-canonical NTP hydrolase)
MEAANRTIGDSQSSRRFYPPTNSDFGPHNTVQGRPYLDAHRERIRAHAKHDAKDGSMERKTWDNPIWLPVLTEEVGEVARVLCENELGDLGDGVTKARLREELVQVAAMACAWIDAIDLEVPRSVPTVAQALRDIDQAVREAKS